MQLQRETGSAEEGEPRGFNFRPETDSPKEYYRPDIRALRRKPFKLPRSPDYRENYPNPQMGFLMWLLSKMRGGMWGRPERPDDLQDMWLQQQQQRPSQPRMKL